MQIPDEEKRRKILQAASDLFTSRPFHKVLLSDVATAAAVGKGTVYIYFKNKEELYLAVLYQAFERLVDQLRGSLESDRTRSPREALGTVVQTSVDYVFRNPQLLELMRSTPLSPDQRAPWDEKRRELTGLIEAVIRRGIRSGQFCDPHPELTARFVLGLVRSALLDGIEGVDEQVVTRHILHFLLNSLAAGKMPSGNGKEDRRLLYDDQRCASMPASGLFRQETPVPLSRERDT
ncbi:MAG: TetR/AcrR family transcriptional regulator [Thermoguttaceae bacterium]|jgi:AcrR family transcriptional regulator